MAGGSQVAGDGLAEFDLDIEGQMPSLKIYTQITFCYEMPDTVPQSVVVEKLTAGLQKLSRAFPWVAGQVVNRHAQPGSSSGEFVIEPLGDIPRFVVKDYTESDEGPPSMDVLRATNFPINKLDEKYLSPRTTLPIEADAHDVDPVLCVQAAFVKGGLLLTFASQHNTMDMTGQGQVMALLSKACHGQDFTEQEIRVGNMSRRGLVPYLDDSYVAGPEMDNQIFQPASAPQYFQGQSVWANFVVSANALDALKDEATRTMPKSARYVSTDDAVSAFLWKSIMKARQVRLKSGTSSILARAVDARSYLGISAQHTGILQNMTYHKLSLEKIVSAPLGVLAAELRAAVDPETSDIAYRTRALATLLRRSPDKSFLFFTASCDPSTGVAMSSWTKTDCYSLDFALGLGTPVSVRRPRFQPFEGLLYLLPKQPQGELTVALCAREDDMKRLQADDMFLTYAKYVG